MGMYTELVLGIEVNDEPIVIDTLERMLSDKAVVKDVTINHPFFRTTRWSYMLLSDSYYFDGQTDSKLVHDLRNLSHYLNVRCNLKNYDYEIELFLDWLCPYIMTEGFLGYMRYEEYADPTLIYKENGKIVYKSPRFCEVIKSFGEK